MNQSSAFFENSRENIVRGAVSRHAFNVRRLAETIADLHGLGEEIKGLSDVDAIRLIQQREGSTPCYGRDVALRPGADGVCLIEGCCWRHFCSAYQSNAAPIDGALHYLTAAELHAFTEFLTVRGRRSGNLPISGLSVTVNSTAALEPLSRKIVIGSPQSTICEAAGGTDILKPFRISFTEGESRSSMYTRYQTIHRSFVWTANPQRIHNWYAAARAFIDDSTIDYLPHISVNSGEVSQWKEPRAPSFERLEPPTFQMLDTPHVAIEGEVAVSDPNFVPLLNLDIPFLESASLDHIHQLMADHPEELSLFRNFLFNEIDKIKDKSISSTTFGSDLRMLRRDVDDQIAKLKTELSRSRLKHYIELTGGVAAAFTLALFCITQHDSHTLQVIGPGGFLYVLSTKLSEYLSARLTLKQNPTYFLWMLGPSKRL